MKLGLFASLYTNKTEPNAQAKPSYFLKMLNRLNYQGMTKIDKDNHKIKSKHSARVHTDPHIPNYIYIYIKYIYSSNQNNRSPPQNPL